MNKGFLFDSFEPRYGEGVEVSPRVTRVTAPNPGPFARWGTNTYLIGKEQLAVIDPGPDLPAHWRTLQRVIGDRRVSHICVSHKHPDHSPLAGRMAAHFNAQVVMKDSQGPQYEALEYWHASSDRWASFGESGSSIRVIETPGHTWGHLSFELLEDNVLFSGDHVMAWATPSIRPPEGDMDVYLLSLEKTISTKYRCLLPAHGPSIEDPASFLESYRAHRLQREAQILRLIATSSMTIPEVVEAAYINLPDDLASAAADTALAHLLRLRKHGRARENGGRWRAVHMAD
jgi:glyoxylase-like metal-dependent hydrolase (beta-lactamase superfamily II)